MAAIDPLTCERCQRPLESDDAISVIEGVCGICRNTAQSLVQPVRADEILSKDKVGGRAFLDDLPSISESAVDSEPWLVEQVEADEKAVSSAGFISVDDGPALHVSSDDDEQNASTDERSDAYAEDIPESACDDQSELGLGAYEADLGDEEPYRVHLDDENAGDEPLIPPGPFSAARRKTSGQRPDLEAISEIFGPDSVPPSEIPSADEDGQERSGSRVDIHRYNPPPPHKSSRNIKQPRRRQRGSAIRAGVLLGLVTAAGLAIYGFGFSDWQVRVERFLARNTPSQVPKQEAFQASRMAELLVDPSGAEILIDGSLLGTTDEQGRIRLTEQELAQADRIEIRASGYHATVLPIDDIVGTSESVIRLLRKPIKVAVHSEPDGADILVDGQIVGQTPSTITIATEQSNAITLRKQGFESVEREIPALSAERDAARVSVKLERIGVMLAVSTAPVPAEVWVDGRFLGLAPIENKLPALYRGRSVEVVARAVGYDDARTQIEIPLQSEDVLNTEIGLTRTMSRVNVRTEPPGGRVVVAGRDYGLAPTMIEFDPAQTGRSVVLDASSRGEYFGRRNIVVPPPGAPREFVVDMTRSAQRVVFVLAADRSAGAERYLVIDEMAQAIEQLDESHRFAVLAASDEGVEAWPYEVAFENASDEQKIRAFDMIRSVRAADEIDEDALLNAVAQLDPSVVWYFSTTDLERAAFESFAEIFPKDKQIALNVVKARSSAADTWLDGFLARHGGELKTLDTVAAAESFE